MILAVAYMMLTSVSIDGNLRIKFCQELSRVRVDFFDAWRTTHKNLATVDYGRLHAGIDRFTHHESNKGVKYRFLSIRFWIEFPFRSLCGNTVTITEPEPAI